MLERERKETILRLLDLRDSVSIHDAVDATGASEATVRRVFIEMENQGLLKRVRGGVERQMDREGGGRKEPPLDSRIGVNREKKRRIAQRAAALLKDGDTIFIDGGSTTYRLVEFISALSLTVVTNSFAIAEHLVRHSACTVILSEGKVDPHSLLVLNNLSADPFANYHASRVFMGIEGITETALTNSEPLLIQAERAMIAHSQDLVVLADGTKFGRTGSLALCPVEKARMIITTADADPALVRILRDKGIEVTIV